MRILITGGFGFVGGRLGQYLSQAGHQVVLGSRHENSSPNWLSKAEFAKINWDEDCDLKQVCDDVDVVIQAAGVNAQDSDTDPVTALEVNGLATARILNAAIHAGVKKFVYLSTAHVYASPLVGAITETTCPRNLHPYATSHLAGENVVLRADQRGQIEGIVLRLSNAFGAPAHKDVNCWMLLVNDLCRQALKTGKLVLQSRGLQQRDFIAMTDVCRVIEHMVTHSDGLTSNLVNVGSGVSQSVFEMAQLIQQRCKIVLGFEPEILRPPTDKTETCRELEYRTDRLNKIGLSTGFDNVAEIDKLLAFCQASIDTI